MAHELIDISKSYTLPAPLNSSSEGEVWVWGDFVLALQTKPQTMMEVMRSLTGAAFPDSPVNYPVVVSAFYRMHRNPHGPSARPILVATLEMMDYAAAAKIQGLSPELTSLLGETNSSQYTKGLFSAGLHFNKGLYKGGDSLEAMRSELFAMLGASLNPEGSPKKLGPLSAIHGNPETGWPAKTKSSKGCLGALMAVAFAVAIMVVVLLNVAG